MATGCSRATGLLPDTHIAVLPADRVLATLDEAVARIYEHGVPRAMTLVTGASATSDIEKIRDHRRPRPAPGRGRRDRLTAQLGPGPI